MAAMKPTADWKPTPEQVKEVKEMIAGMGQIKSIADIMPKSFGVYVEKAPWLCKTFANIPYVDWPKILSDREVELVMIGMLMAMEMAPGVALHIALGKERGIVTDEDVMAIAHLAAYEAAKCKLAANNAAIEEGLQRASTVKV